MFHVDLKQKWALVSLTSQSPASISLAVRQLNVPRSQLKLRGPTFQPPAYNLDTWIVGTKIFKFGGKNIQICWQLFQFSFTEVMCIFATFWRVSQLYSQGQQLWKQKCRRIHCDLFWLMQMSCHGNEDQSVGDSSQFILMLH